MILPPVELNRNQASTTDPIIVEMDRDHVHMV